MVLQPFQCWKIKSKKRAGKSVFYDLDRLGKKNVWSLGMMKLHTRYWMNVGILSVMQTERQEWLFVYDDYGRLIAYVAGVDGEKQLVYSVQVHKNEAGESIYTEKSSADDENGLPVYDKSGHLTMKEEKMDQ